MISSYLQGGLGNQLFQMSAAISVGLENNVQPAFDINNHDLPKQGRKCENYLKTIFRNITFSSSLPLTHIYHEPHYHYRKIEYIPNMCLIGYFQSEKYFEKNADVIRELFSVDKKTEDIIKEKYGEILKNKTVAVHIRRGDYLQYSDTHPPCSREYYKEAMAHFPEDFIYLFFSDDLGWCRENFAQDNIIFVENEEDIIDFYFISMCKNIIISNSSFSWWSAWLNESNDKIVVAPKKWFGPSINYDTRDLIPSRWKKI